MCDDPFLTLTPSDLAMFARFGVGTTLLRAACVRRVTDAEARAHGFSLRDRPPADLSGLVFPYFNPTTGDRVTSRLRRDRPETDDHAKPKNKYLTPYGDNGHLYFPPGAASLLSDPKLPVVFVEAEKSSLAITALGERNARQILAVGTGGCWSWRGKTGIRTTPNGDRKEERGPLSDLWLFDWEDERPAIIIFDANTTTNSRVRRARWEFAQVLVCLGAKVLFVDIPREGDINGPDDLIGVAGDEATLRLFDTARPFPQQAEEDAVAALALFSKTCDLKIRDAALDAIARVVDSSHQRTLVDRAARALGERGKKAIETELGKRAEALREYSAQAKEAVERGRLLNMKVDPASLIAEVERFYCRRLGLPDGAALVLALFTLNTYVFDVFDTTPYIQIDSAVGGCGKTTLLFHLEATCCRAYLGCDPTEAVLYRRIDRDCPTWLMDEASVLRGHEERARMIRAILDVGYRKGATVPRIEGEDNHLRDFKAYCPKAFALVGSLKGTLLDRCIILHLQKTFGLPKSKLKVINCEASPLREKLQAYAAQYRNELERLYDEEPEEGYWPQLDGREEELWGPLLFQARIGGEEIEKRALSVALSFSRRKGDIALEEDHNLALSLEILEVLENVAADWFSPGDVQRALAGKEAWGEKLGNCKNDKARECSIGAFLKNFRLPSRTRGRIGTLYRRAEAIDTIRRHTPLVEALHATVPDNSRVPPVASPEGGLATENTQEHLHPTGEATQDSPLASGEEGLATTQPGANTGRVTSGKSNMKRTQGVLKF